MSGESDSALLARLDERTSSTLTMLDGLRADVLMHAERTERLIEREVADRMQADKDLAVRIEKLEQGPTAVPFGAIADRDTAPIDVGPPQPARPQTGPHSAVTDEEARARTRVYIALAALIAAATTALGLWSAHAFGLGG